MIFLDCFQVFSGFDVSKKRDSFVESWHKMASNVTFKDGWKSDVRSIDWLLT
jgi:hypothetical protein